MIVVALVAAVVATVVAVVAIVVARRAMRAAAAPQSRMLRELLHAVSKGDVEKLPALLRQVDLHMVKLEDRLENAERRLAASMQKIGLARFDADPELGGKVSFSLVLLDENNDGVIVTSVYRLEDSRIFLREVQGGCTQHSLLTEEARALEMALDEELQQRRQQRHTGAPGTDLRLAQEKDGEPGGDVL